MWHTWPFGTGTHDGFLFIVLKFLFIGLILGIVILILKLILSPSLSNKTDTKTDPLQILKVRLARGEVSEEDYERLKKKLTEE